MYSMLGVVQMPLQTYCMWLYLVTIYSCMAFSELLVHYSHLGSNAAFHHTNSIEKKRNTMAVVQSKDHCIYSLGWEAVKTKSNNEKDKWSKTCNLVSIRCNTIIIIHCHVRCRFDYELLSKKKPNSFDRIYFHELYKL